MTSNKLDLPEGAYAPVTAHHVVRVGDICHGVGLPDQEDWRFYDTDDLPERFLVLVEILYVLVVSVYREYAVVAPIMTADVAADRDQFAALVDSGRNTSRWMRLPPLATAWRQDAVALLFMPQTLVEDALVDKRLAAMHPAASNIVSRRFARAFQ
jgi:hypothetical protein